MREIVAAGGGLALDVFAYRVAAAVAAMSAALGGLDALVFTAGIGEHSPLVRARVCERLAFLGVELDQAQNEQGRAGLHDLRRRRRSARRARARGARRRARGSNAALAGAAVPDPRGRGPRATSEDALPCGVLGQAPTMPRNGIRTRATTLKGAPLDPRRPARTCANPHEYTRRRPRGAPDPHRYMSTHPSVWGTTRARVPWASDALTCSARCGSKRSELLERRGNLGKARGRLARMMARPSGLAVPDGAPGLLVPTPKAVEFGGSLAFPG